jgi:hypothetical protein
MIGKQIRSRFGRPFQLVVVTRALETRINARGYLWTCSKSSHHLLSAVGLDTAFRVSANLPGPWKHIHHVGWLLRLSSPQPHAPHARGAPDRSAIAHTARPLPKKKVKRIKKAAGHMWPWIALSMSPRRTDKAEQRAVPCGANRMEC